MVFRNQDLVSKCAHCCWGVVAHSPLSSFKLFIFWEIIHLSTCGKYLFLVWGFSFDFIYGYFAYAKIIARIVALSNFCLGFWDLCLTQIFHTSALQTFLPVFSSSTIEKGFFLILKCIYPNVGKKICVSLGEQAQCHRLTHHLRKTKTKSNFLDM